MNENSFASSGQRRADFLQSVREVARLKHFSIHTEDSYVQTIRRFLDFHGAKAPAEMGMAEIRDYLTHLALVGQVAASTQNVACNALIFLYREVLNPVFI